MQVLRNTLSKSEENKEVSFYHSSTNNFPSSFQKSGSKTFLWVNRIAHDKATFTSQILRLKSFKLRHSFT